MIHRAEDLPGGDILFLISCSEIIPKNTREKYNKALVIHASDLPKGRGWSPYIWSILRGETEITLTLFEAEDAVDSGNIWKKMNIELPRHVIFNEINKLLFDAILNLMSFAIENYEKVIPYKQEEIGATYFPRRFPRDSELDINSSLLSQFNLIRICDPKRYPAFFKLHGYTYKITIEKIDDPNND